MSKCVYRTQPIQQIRPMALAPSRFTLDLQFKGFGGGVPQTPKRPPRNACGHRDSICEGVCSLLNCKMHENTGGGLCGALVAGPMASRSSASIPRCAAAAPGFDAFLRSFILVGMFQWKTFPMSQLLLVSISILWPAC
jgi:hypothetical protein